MERKMLTGGDFLGRRKPDLVIVMIGTNDTRHELKGIEENIRELYKNIEATFQSQTSLGNRNNPQELRMDITKENNPTRDRKALNEMLMNIARGFKNFVFKNTYKAETVMIEEGKVRRREINKQMAYILVEQGRKH